MAKLYKVTYRAIKRLRSIVIMAFSDEDAKQRFYRTYPKYEIIKIEEAE